jgi:hypothetical protein
VPPLTVACSGTAQEPSPSSRELTARALVTAPVDARDRRSKILARTDFDTWELAVLTTRMAAERARFFAALSPTEYDVLHSLLANVYNAHATTDEQPG